MWAKNFGPDIQNLVLNHDLLKGKETNLQNNDYLLYLGTEKYLFKDFFISNYKFFVISKHTLKISSLTRIT